LSYSHHTVLKFSLVRLDTVL